MEKPSDAITTGDKLVQAFERLGGAITTNCRKCGLEINERDSLEPGKAEWFHNGVWTDNFPHSTKCVDDQAHWWEDWQGEHDPRLKEL